MSAHAQWGMQPPRFFNTLGRAVQDFVPLHPPNVAIYACGPTVYDYAHIGNFRYFVWVDVLHRYLRWRGFIPTLVMNLTDVDDHTIEGARRQHSELGPYTRRYIEAFFEDLETLGVRRADVNPRATEHIDDMVNLVAKLLRSGHAYRSGGSIYFRVRSFGDYGRLGRMDSEQMRSSGRADRGVEEKEDARDFALWKAPKSSDEPSWDTVLGAGRPGWHLECSAMSMKYLGATFDLHLGGEDLIFPHHENEIAQSEAATGKPFVRCWLHCSHLVVDGMKMSKSLGNFRTLRDLVEQGHDPVAVRQLLASVHYRRQMNLTSEALEQASAAVQRLREFVARAEQEVAGLPAGVPGHGEGLESSLRRARSAFAECLDDDLNTAGALGHMFTLVREANTALDRGEAVPRVVRAILDWLYEVDGIWNIVGSREPLQTVDVEVEGRTLAAVGPQLPADTVALIVARMKARGAGDFASADRIRDQLAVRGITLEDTPQGVRWHRHAR